MPTGEDDVFAVSAASGDILWHHKGNLDQTMEAEILDVLRDIWAGGTTVVLATHRADLARMLRRRTITLGSGRVVKDEG